MSALMGDAATDTSAEGAASADPGLVLVKTDRLMPNPHNPRDDIGDLEDLASIVTIQRQSLLVVTRAAYVALYPGETEACRGKDYIVANGNRRHAAAVKFGRDELICVVNDDVAESRAALMRAAYDENVQRMDFDPIEEAKAVLAIVAEYPSQKEAAEAEGWSESTLSLRKNLLKLHPDLQDMVRVQARGGEGGLSIRRARRLGAVKGIAEMTLDQQLEQLEVLRLAEVRAKAEKDAEKAEARAAKAASGAAAERTAAAEFSAENSARTPAAGQPPAAQERKADPAPAAAPSALSPEPAKVAAQFSAENPTASVLPEPRNEQQPNGPTPTQDEAGAGGKAAKLDVRLELDWSDMDRVADTICRSVPPQDALKLMNALLIRLKTLVPDKD